MKYGSFFNMIQNIIQFLVSNNRNIKDFSNSLKGFVILKLVRFCDFVYFSYKNWNFNAIISIKLI